MNYSSQAADAFASVFGTDGASASPADAAWAAWEKVKPTANGANGSATRRPKRAVLRKLSTYELREPEWLWADRIPLGAMTMIAGPGKRGKSTLVCDLVARVTTGRPLPHDGRDPGGPGSVVLLSIESSMEIEVGPRLRAAGADMDRVYDLPVIEQPDGRETTPTLTADIAEIEAAIESIGDCRMVVFDPITNYVEGIDDHKNSEVRGLLSQLAKMAERQNVAVVLVSHTNKGKWSNAQHAVMGSSAYNYTCRANFLVDRDPDDPGRCLLAENGCNWAVDIKTLPFRMLKTMNGSVVQWADEAVETTADDMAAFAARSQDRRRGQNDDSIACDDWLKETLSGGMVAAGEMPALAKAAGFTIDQAKRAKSRLKVKSHREGAGKTAAWFWWLPGTPKGEAADAEPGADDAPAADIDQAAE